MRSIYLCLYLKSLSWNPWNFSGSTPSDFDNNIISLACIDISPVWVLNTKPFTPIISPISNFLKSLYESSPTSSRAT